MATNMGTKDQTEDENMKPHRVFDVEAIRADFPILGRQIRGKPLIYLDNGASTLKPNVVIDRISQYYRDESSNVHRGAHFLAEQGTIAFEQARETTRRFINAALHEEIIFTRGTTDSINSSRKRGAKTISRAVTKSFSQNLSTIRTSFLGR